MRLLSVVGARPQFVKLAPVDEAVRARGHEHVVVHTGQHYDTEMSESFFDDLQIPDPMVNLGVGSGSHGAQTASMLESLEREFVDRSPDWVIVYGDTNSTLAAAVAAVKLGRRLAHVEAGLRSFNRAMPEEHNRILTDHASDLLLAPTAIAVDHLTREGLADRAALVGDVMVDVFRRVEARVAADGTEMSGGPFHLATIHRQENTDDGARLTAIIDALAGLPVDVLLPVHPRLAARSAEHGITLKRGSIRTVAPMTYPDLVRALSSCDGVVTDSGGLQKEAYLAARPCTTVRQETEWVETLHGGWNVLVDDPAALADVVCRARPGEPQGTPFGDGSAAQAVVREIESRS